MRILLLTNLYPPDVQGGAEILAADIAGGLTRLGHEVLVLTSGAQTRGEDGIWRTLRSAPPAHFDRRRPVWRITADDGRASGERGRRHPA